MHDICIFISSFLKRDTVVEEGQGLCERKDGRAKRRIRLTAHVFAACQPLLWEDLVWSVRIQAHNYFAKYWTVRTINLEDCADQSGCEWVIVCGPLLSCINKRRCAPLCFPLCRRWVQDKSSGESQVHQWRRGRSGRPGQHSAWYLLYFIFLSLMGLYCNNVFCLPDCKK